MRSLEQSLVWSCPCRVRRLLAGEEGLREGAGGGAGRKLYVILGWLLNNCFNEMECSVFSTCLAEAAFFFCFLSWRGERSWSCPIFFCFKHSRLGFVMKVEVEYCSW